MKAYEKALEIYPKKSKRTIISTMCPSYVHLKDTEDCSRDMQEGELYNVCRRCWESEIK